MIDPQFRQRLEAFTDGRPLRSALTATSGPSVIWTVGLLTAAAFSSLWLDASAGIAGTTLVVSILIATAAATWFQRETTAFVLTDRELIVLSTHRLAPRTPRAVIRRTPINEVSLTVSTSAHGFATMCIDGEHFNVPSRDFTNAHGLGQLVEPAGASRFALN